MMKGSGIMLVLGKLQIEGIVLVVAVMADEAETAETLWPGVLTDHPINLLP
jgi:hypothetical protein